MDENTAEQLGSLLKTTVKWWEADTDFGAFFGNRTLVFGFRQPIIPTRQPEES